MSILTVDQFAKKCKVSGEVIRRRIRAGDISICHIKGSSRMGIDTFLNPISKNRARKAGRPRKIS